MVVIAAVWLFIVFALRVIPPPITPLMAIRSFEAWISDKPSVRQWEWVSIEQIPRSVQQAVVAAEDARFMEHWGIDLGALEDVIDDASDGRRVRGASTITMQTVKNVFFWPGRSYIRKVLEGMIAPIAGLVWGKKRTLELYLNIIEWGDGIYGIEAAARRYFRKSASQLSVDEATALASVLPNPRVLHPLRLSRAGQRRFARIINEAHQTRIP
jgi:monofunctional biosynthetic peptidoglycan transglycosylase